MKIIQGAAATRAAFRRPKVTLGTFDGVHLGHQRVLRHTLSWARATDCDAVVVTFDRKPRHVLAGRPFDQITSMQHRLRLFDQIGLDAVVLMDFTPAIAALEPEAFVSEWLVRRLGASGVLLGHDTRFGRAGRGDLALLLRLGRELGFEACSSEVVAVDGAPVSSTRIREAVRAGDLAAAERMLGRRVSLLGTVVHGAGIGRGLGFPTANLDLHHEVRPPEGVYATLATIGGRVYESATNIGRPGPPGVPSTAGEAIVESFILDFTGDLYGQDIELRFVERLRDEAVFASEEALKAQIARDVARTRARLAGLPEKEARA
jgi:riboflavin kinase/FMN adenylyltransferase